MLVIETIAVVILYLLLVVALLLGLGSLIVLFVKAAICIANSMNKDKDK